MHQITHKIITIIIYVYKLQSIHSRVFVPQQTNTTYRDHHHHRLCLEITISPQLTVNTITSHTTHREKEHGSNMSAKWLMLHQPNAHSDLFLILLERLYHHLWNQMTSTSLNRARMIKPNQIKSKQTGISLLHHSNADVENPQTNQAGSRASNIHTAERKASQLCRSAWRRMCTQVEGSRW